MVAVAIGGAAVLGAGASIVSGNKAANAQKNAADQSVAEQRRQYDQTREDLAPWRTTGGAALGRLADLYGVGPGGAKTEGDYAGFEASPGYQWRLDQGTQAAERSAAARGLLGSGATMKAVQRYGEGLASSEFENYANHLAGIAGVGQAATNTTAAAGQNAANNISSAYTNAGNARASSYANTGSAINGTLNNLASIYAYQQGGGFAGSGGVYGSGGGSGNGFGAINYGRMDG